jgi:hypothetical protein
VEFGLARVAGNDLIEYWDQLFIQNGHGVSLRETWLVEAPEVGTQVPTVA